MASDPAMGAGQTTTAQQAEGQGKRERELLFRA